MSLLKVVLLLWTPRTIVVLVLLWTTTAHAFLSKRTTPPSLHQKYPHKSLSPQQQQLVSFLQKGDDLMDQDDDDDAVVVVVRRRAFLTTMMTISTTTTSIPTQHSWAATSNDAIDYAKIQDLLGNTETNNYNSYNTDAATKRPTYLTEPTEDFKQNEIKASNFKRQQLLQKQEFLKSLTAISENTSEDVLIDNFDRMRKFVQQYKGLPQDVTKDYCVKIIRSRKRVLLKEKLWTTNVEIAYQDFLLQVMYQQSPNTNRDTEGFL